MTVVCHTEAVTGSSLFQQSGNAAKLFVSPFTFYPLRSLPLAAKNPANYAQTWMIVDDMIEQAAAIGAQGFIFGAGTPSFYDACAEDFTAFDRFCNELCDKLKLHGITAMLEPFDMDIDKKFLYGPIDDCVKLAERITTAHDNFGFELDMALCH